MGPQIKKVVPVITQAGDFDDVFNGYLTGSNKLALLLDYDGTLAPIIGNPNFTAMPIEIEKSLNTLASNPNIFLAVISGRGIVDIQNKVGIQNITYAGNHGIEIQTPNGTREDYQLPTDIQEKYKKLVEDLKRQLSKNGAWVEDKRVSLTYHYRDTPANLVEEQRALAIEIIESYGFRANQAHSAIEAKPPVNWNKGEATNFILKKNFGENYASLENLKIIFAGDDTTDEDAMKILQGVGKSFRISTDPDIETYADYRLSSQLLMSALLERLTNIYKH